MRTTNPCLVGLLGAACLFTRTLSAQTISFNGQESYPAPSLSFAIGDFNNDGKPDIVSGAHTVVLLAGRGDGTFASPVPVALKAHFGAALRTGYRRGCHPMAPKWRKRSLLSPPAAK